MNEHERRMSHKLQIIVKLPYLALHIEAWKKDRVNVQPNAEPYILCVYCNST